MWEANNQQQSAAEQISMTALCFVENQFSFKDSKNLLKRRCCPSPATTVIISYLIAFCTSLLPLNSGCFLVLGKYLFHCFLPSSVTMTLHSPQVITGFAELVCFYKPLFMIALPITNQYSTIIYMINKQNNKLLYSQLTYITIGGMDFGNQDPKLVSFRQYE
jgi:ABC-type spermidine/putrescine transport system permease subunit II